jgi:hypothetical protein
VTLRPNGDIVFVYIEVQTVLSTAALYDHEPVAGISGKVNHVHACISGKVNHVPVAGISGKVNHALSGKVNHVLAGISGKVNHVFACLSDRVTTFLPSLPTG